MTDKEFLDEIKAREELYQRGYHMMVCEKCSGMGSKMNPGYFVPNFHICPECGGKGLKWVKGSK